jgi:hypothetical protein
MPPTETVSVENLPKPARPRARTFGAAATVVVALVCIPLLWPKQEAAGLKGSRNEAHPAAAPQEVTTPIAADVAVTADESAATAERPSEGAHSEPAGPADHESVPAAGEDDAHRRTAVGTWTQYDRGPRTLTLREDGTGTMLVEPAGAWAYLIGAKVTMQIEWKVEKGRAIMNSISGQPETAFKAITQLFGKERDREIVELTAEKLVLLDNEDGSKSEWTRAEEK